jgi:chemotaxis protein methyltransferase CheR
VFDVVDERSSALLDTLLRPRIGHAPKPWPQQLRRTVTKLALERKVSVPELLSQLIAQPQAAAIEALVAAATISHTAWFRHVAHFERLRSELSRLGRPARIWSAGCASGEEPYSIALAARDVRVPVHVLATDVSSEALEVARAARYPAHLVRRAGIPVTGGETWQVPDEVRASVRIVRASLSDANPAGGDGPFDFIFCRNVLIYFDIEGGTQVLLRLLANLKPGGALVVAPVDALRVLPEPLRRVEPLGWLECARPRARSTMPPSLSRPHKTMPPPDHASEAPIDDQLVRAARALGLGALEDAEAALASVLRADPLSAEAWFLLGESLERRGESTQAVTAFKRAAQHAAEDAEGRTLANASLRRARSLESISE